MPRLTKNASRERILSVGARAIRRHGYDGFSIGTLMKQAGLTHGAFYTHFSSREVMLAALVARAGTESNTMFAGIAGAAPANQNMQALIEAYLSQEHLEHPENGCPIAGLGTETARQTPEVRQAFTRCVKEMIDVIALQVDHGEVKHVRDRAITVAATMIGALVIARAINEEALVEKVLTATREHLLSQS